MFNLGFSEIIFLSFLVLVLVGPKQLPQLARMIVRFLNEFKATTNKIKLSLQESDQTIDSESHKPQEPTTLEKDKS